MKKSKTTKKKWELKMKEKEPLQCWIVNIMSRLSSTINNEKMLQFNHSSFKIRHWTATTLSSFSVLIICAIGKSPSSSAFSWLQDSWTWDFSEMMLFQPVIWSSKKSSPFLQFNIEDKRRSIMWSPEITKQDRKEPWKLSTESLCFVKQISSWCIFFIINVSSKEPSFQRQDSWKISPMSVSLCPHRLVSCSSIFLSVSFSLPVFSWSKCVLEL